MNQDQKKYLLKRVDDLCSTKIREMKTTIPQVDVTKFINKLKVNEKAYSISKISNDLLKRLRQDKKMPNQNKYNTFLSISEFQMFSNFSEVNAEYNKADEQREDLIEEKQAKIESYVIKLKDEMMLGDSKEALKQLADFEKMKF